MEPVRQPYQPPKKPQLNGIDLLFGDEPSATVEKVEAPALDGNDLLFGSGTGLPKQEAKPEEKSWGQWISDSWNGVRDPNYEKAGSVFSQHQDLLQNVAGTGAILGDSDAALGDKFEKALGDRFIRRERDANGYDIIVTKGPDGTEQFGYVNVPGFESQDLTRAIYGSLPYAITGGAAGAALKGAPVVFQAVGQGIVGAGTSAGGDVISGTQGSDQGVDAEKALLTGAFGLGAPLAGSAVGALWRRFVTIPGLVDKTTGQLTAKGVEAAKAAGVDPNDFTPELSKRFAKVFAETGDEAQAATQVGLDHYGIPATRGQVSKDPYLLTQEEAMRRRLYGEGAQHTMRGFDQTQKDAIRHAALGADNQGTVPQSAMAPQKGIGEQLSPTRQPGASDIDRMPATLGTSVKDTLASAREAARVAEGNLWDDNVKNLAATPQALATLRSRVETALANETAFTKTGEEMAKVIGQFAEGKLPVSQAGGINLKPVQSVDQMRRRLGDLVGSSEKGSDKRQAGMIYDAFNDWIGESAKQNLLAGDPAAALQLVKARGFTKEVREIFSPKLASGKTSPAAKRIEGIMDADSGERVIDSLFGSQGSRSVNQGAVDGLKSIKKALDQFASPDQAKQAWDDIRLAYWSRLVTNKSGDLVGPTAMVSNIKNAFQNQSTIMRTLYDPLEQRQMRHFLRAMETVAYKPPNASGSGYTAASLMKDGLVRLIDAFGIGVPARAAIDFTGLDKAFGAGVARKAVNQIAKPKKPNVGGAMTGAGHTYHRIRDDD